MSPAYTSVHVFYRLANRPAAQSKEKLAEATKEACLLNFLEAFPREQVTVFGDRLDAATSAAVDATGVKRVDVDEGSGGGNFRAAAMAAMRLPDDAVVYLIEDDFLHRQDASEALLDGFNVGADYVTLYDHPDKYLSPDRGGNPKVRDGGERTRLLCGNVCHWKLTNSTVMTFATRVETLKRDWNTFLRFCGERYTDDYRLFKRLSWKGRRLVSAVPGFATHSETGWLSPFVDWRNIAKRAAESVEVVNRFE